MTDGIKATRTLEEGVLSLCGKITNISTRHDKSGDGSLDYTYQIIRVDSHPASQNERAKAVILASAGETSYLVGDEVYFEYATSKDTSKPNIPSAHELSMQLDRVSGREIDMNKLGRELFGAKDLRSVGNIYVDGFVKYTVPSRLQREELK